MPKISTYTRPEITGDTENGRSTRVTRKLLPRKSNLAMAHDAARPKAVLSGTATAAISSLKVLLRENPVAWAAYDAPLG